MICSNLVLRPLHEENFDLHSGLAPTPPGHCEFGNYLILNTDFHHKSFPLLSSGQSTGPAFAHRWYLGGERRSEAFLLYSSSAIDAAAAGRSEGSLSSGMLVFVLPAYEGDVVKSWRIVQPLWPVGSNPCPWMDPPFAGNDTEVREPQVADLSWRCTPGMKFSGTAGVGPPNPERVLDSCPLGTFGTCALAEPFSGCKVAFGILLACLHFQWTVWSPSDW